MRLPLRSAALDRLRATRAIDVLIIGGGINGAGLLRELALNGVNALLVDQADFAAGATSASSRMIHGGLRYLENGEFRLVRESLHERNRLLKNAPHAVKPLPTTIPIFSRWSGFTNATAKFFDRTSKPSKRGAALVKIGLTLYDLFTARDRVLPTHTFAGRTAALRARPLLHPGIVCTATYYDAWIPLPERLCLELIDDALAAHPDAQALNYVAAIANTADGSVTLRDEVTGENFSVTPRVVVNATGAWIDFANTALGTPTRFIGGTKGSHLIVDHPELLAATAGQQLFFENEDGRICIFFPLQGKVLVGSTDIRIENPDDAVCDEGEVDYLLQSVRIVFPAIKIGREHIVSRFCGVRPLPASEAGFTGRISRDHARRDLPPAPPARPWPVYSLVGGKWSTFRAFAEQVADKIFADLGRSRRVGTHGTAIGGREPEPNYAEPAALMQITRTEAVVHLDDLLLRRTPLALFGMLTPERFAAIAEATARELGWDAAHWADEIDRTCKLLASRHGIHLAAGNPKTQDFITRPSSLN
jgi:glycerol-3-phosphate dehydrogenase